MDALEAILTRRSVGLVSEKPVPDELIEKILEAGTWAPNHFKTEPWRFFVLTDDARKALGETLAGITERGLEDPATEENRRKIEKAKHNPLRAPVVIAVAVEPSDQPRVILKEEYAAVNAGVQNMLLAAHALGLGAMWRTGKACYDREICKLFGLSEKGEVVGFIYIGYPSKNLPAGKRSHFREKTKWFRSSGDF
jgi:nitroreductase